MTVTLFAVAIASFAIGSIPFGFVIGRLFFGTDIRAAGSGNIGAMNALRTLGKGGAIAVLLLDAAKGFVPAFLALHYGTDVMASLAATFAVLGHCFSPWMNWKGGKGVATSIGAIFALAWPAGLAVVAMWIIGALLLTRYSSVGSMLAHIAAPVALYVVTHSAAQTIYGVFAALLILWTHRDNINRLQSGTENRISFTRRAQT